MTIWSVSLSTVPKIHIDFFFCLIFSSLIFLSITDASTLPAELQRLLNTIRELDERSHCKALFHKFVLCMCMYMYVCMHACDVNFLCLIHSYGITCLKNLCIILC